MPAHASPRPGRGARTRPGCAASAPRPARGRPRRRRPARARALSCVLLGAREVVAGEGGAGQDGLGGDRARRRARRSPAAPHRRSGRPRGRGGPAPARSRPRARATAPARARRRRPLPRVRPRRASDSARPNCASNSRGLTASSARNAPTAAASSPDAARLNARRRSRQPWQLVPRVGARGGGGHVGGRVAQVAEGAQALRDLGVVSGRRGERRCPSVAAPRAAGSAVEALAAATSVFSEGSRSRSNISSRTPEMK